ncbi:hypothetical protein Hdeb2414_s0008g00284581 [Helianthus debilis subsp. tardiflorus]
MFVMNKVPVMVMICMINFHCHQEQEFGYNHPIGGITIPCSEDVFIDLASRFGAF